jgi:nicotinamidase-related amidase
MTLKDSALVLIEYQNEWLDPKGKLRFLLKDLPQFDSAIEHSKQALQAARNAGMQVIHMGLHLYPDHREMGGLGATQFGLRGVIPRAGTWRTDETGHLHPEPFVPRDLEFAGAGRTGGSVFAGTNLDIFLRNQNIKKVYLMGFALHVCVLSSLCQGHDLGYEMKVLEDCCAAFTPEQRHSVLSDVVHHFGERVNNQEFMRRLAA